MNRAEIERVFRAEWGPVLATTIAALGDFDRAEEALQEAFIIALERWESDGIPDNPAAWLTTVARRKGIDALRRDRRQVGGSDELENISEDGSDPISARTGRSTNDDTVFTRIDARLDHPVDDDLLRLIFTCCHPALAREAQVALTLRAVGGLTSDEIARAFLVPRETMQQRLVRAKKKIREAGIPYRVPPAPLLRERLPAVLAVLYLIFNEGYAASSGATWVRDDLCEEALRLARILVRLLPDETDVHAHAALIALQHSRAEARVDADGRPILLEDQDRARWSRSAIDEGVGHLARARTASGGIATPTLLQAEIAALHAQAPSSAATDWGRIVRLHELLLALHPSPVIALNRAAALAMRDGAEAGLAELERVAAAAGGALDEYRYLHSARGELLLRLGRKAEARAAFERALEWTENEAERGHLEGRIGRLSSD